MYKLLVRIIHLKVLCGFNGILEKRKNKWFIEDLNLSCKVFVM